MVTPPGQTPASTTACVTIFSPRLLQSYSPATGSSPAHHSLHNEAMKEAAGVPLLLGRDCLCCPQPAFSIFYFLYIVAGIKP